MKEIKENEGNEHVDENELRNELMIKYVYYLSI